MQLSRVGSIFTRAVLVFTYTGACIKMSLLKYNNTPVFACRRYYTNTYNTASSYSYVYWLKSMLNSVSHSYPIHPQNIQLFWMTV